MKTLHHFLVLAALTCSGSPRGLTPQQTQQAAAQIDALLARALENSGRRGE